MQDAIGLLRNAGIRLQHGDIFLSRNPMALGKIICAVQRFWSLDNQSDYSHSGIIVGPDTGQTLEALYRVGFGSLDQYLNERILIGRHRDMDPGRHYSGMKIIDEHIGQRYPFHRLLFHLIPPIAKYINFGYAVCSELTAKYLVGCGFINTWRGWTPANLEDMIDTHRKWTTIFEGHLM